MESYVVIGGGIAGLTAANALAGQDAKVILFEQSDHLGGRARSQNENGYIFNLGPHALYGGGHASRTLRAWNIPFSGGNPPTAATGSFVRDRHFYPMFTNLGGLLKSRLFTVREKVEVANLFRLFANAKADAAETTAAWFDRHISSLHVREFAATVIRISTYAVDIDRLSAQAALAQVASALKHNVLYLDGGWQTLIDGLAQRARLLGVDIRCGEPIASLESVLAKYNPTGIVLAVGPKQVEQITAVNLASAPPVSMASLDLGLKAVPANIPKVAFALDQPLYFSVHSAAARLATPGREVVHVAKYLSQSRQHDPKTLRAELEDYATLVMPDWRSHVEFERFLPDLTVTRRMLGIANQPNVDLLKTERIAIAGDWVGSDGMLADAAVASALRAAGFVRRAKAAAA